jgi:hypothetical protein
MEPPERRGLTLVRLIGVLLVVISILDLGLYWAKCSIPEHKTPVQIVPVLLNLIPAVVGFVVLIKSREIAEWISNTFDL